MPELFKKNLDSRLDPRLISTKAASEISGYSPDYLARLCREEKIEGLQVGRSWLVNRESLDTFVKEQEVRKQARSKELRVARGKEYRRAQEPIISAALGKVAKATGSRVRAPRRSPQPMYSQPLAALAIALVVVAGSAYASTDARVLSALSAMPGAAAQLAFDAMPNLEPSSSFRVMQATSTGASAPAIATAMPPVPNARDASRAFALLAPDSGMAAIASARALEDDARAPIGQTSVGATAADRIAFISSIAHDPFGSFVRAYVYGGEYLYDAGAGIGTAYLSGITHAGSGALGMAATLRDGIARAPRVSDGIISAYIGGIYAFNDAGPKIADHAVVAFYDLGVTANNLAVAIPSALRDVPSTVSHDAGSTALALRAGIASHGSVPAVASRFALAPASQEAAVAASVPAEPAATAPARATAAAPLAARISAPISSLYARAVQAEGAFVSLPLKAEDTVLGFAGYTASLMDGVEGAGNAAVPVPTSAAQPSNAAASIALAPTGMSGALHTALASVSSFFQQTGSFAHSLFSAGLRSLAMLLPNGSIVTPTLTVISTGPSLEFPVPSAAGVARPTNSGDLAVNAGSTGSGGVQNIINNYFPQTSLVGGVFDQAVMAVVRPFVSDSIEAAYKNFHGGGDSGASRDGATLTNVDIQSGNAVLTSLTADSATIGSSSITEAAIGTVTADTATVGALTTTGTTTFATTTINGGLTTNGDLAVTGTLSANNATFANLSSNSVINAPAFNATDTNATSSFANLTANNASVTSATFGAATTTTFFATLAQAATGIFDSLTATIATITNLTTTNATTTNSTSTNSFIGSLSATNATTSFLSANSFNINGATFTSLLGTGLVNSSGSLAVATSSFSGTGSNFDADLLDGLDSTYFLTNGYSTTSADAWLATKSTDDLAEGSTSLYFTAARARDALSFSGAGLSYATSTGVLSIASGYSIPLTASTTDWNTAYLNRITAANAPLSFSGNVLSIAQAGALQDGYLSSADWNLFNDKQAALTFSYPLVNTSNTVSLAFGTSTNNVWGGLQTFTNAPKLGALTGLIYGNAGTLNTVGTSTATLGLGLTGSLTTLGTGQSLSIATSSLFSGSTGQLAYFNGANSLTGTSSVYLAPSGQVGIGATSNLNGQLTLNGPIGTQAEGDIFREYDSGDAAWYPVIARYDTSSSFPGGTYVFGDGTNANVGIEKPGGGDVVSFHVKATNSSFNGAVSVGSLAIGSLNGFLKATAGGVSTSLIDLSADVTSTLPQANGGTGISSYTPGEVLYADNTGSLVALPTGSNGQVLKLQAGLPAWGQDQTIGEGGSDGIFATSSSKIYPLDTSNTLLVGSNATSTDNSIFEVHGQAFVSSKLAIGTTSPSAPLSVAGNALISGSVNAGSLSLAGSSFTSLLGTGLSNKSGFLTIATSSFSGSGSSLNADLLDGLDSSYFLANGYSTTSANAWLATKNTDALAEGSTNLYFTDARADARINATSTISTLTSAPSLGTVSTALSGILKASSGVLSVATPGTDYENPLTFSYPLTRSANTVSLAFGTTTSNTWAGTQTFTNVPVFSALAGGLVATNATTHQAYSAATSTATLGLGLTGSLTGVGAGQSLSIATSSLFSGSAGQLAYFSGANALAGTSNIVISGGKVGIGTTSPFAPLSVSGNTYINGNLTANGAIAFTGLGTGLVKSTGGTLGLAVSGTDYAPATSGNGILYGNGSGGFMTATISAPLTFAGGALGIQQASGSQNGYLSSTDWTTFNNKVATSRAILTTYPLLGGGDLSANRTLSLAFGTTTANTWSQLQTLAGGFVSQASSTATGAFTVGGNLTLGGGISANGTFGTNGQLLQTTGTGVQWVSTSTLGFASGTVAGSANQVAYYDGTGVLGGTSNFTFDGTDLAVSGGTVSASQFFADDSAAKPGYSWAADDTTGMYHAGSNLIGFATGGIGRVFIDANGNLGIGTGAPAYALDALAQNTDTSDGVTWTTPGAFEGNPGSGPQYANRILFNNTNSTNGQNVLDFAHAGVSKWYIGNDYNGNGSQTFAISDATVGGGTARFYIDSAGKTGIGTVVPASQLHVYQNSTDTGSGAGLTIEQDGTGDAVTQYLLTGGQRWMTGIDNSDGDKFKISSGSALGSSDRFVITTAGNVGIGTTSPVGTLSVVGAATFGANSDTVIGSSNLTSSQRGNLYYDGSTGRYNIVSTTNIGLGLGTGGVADRLVIGSTGNVGIGTTSPFAKLSVNGDLALTGGIYDSTATRGTAGQLLQTTGTGVEWVSTSTLGFASGTVAGSANQVAYYDGTGVLGGTSNFTFDGTDLAVGGTITAGSQFIGAGGTGNSGTPPYSFAGDLTTGIFHPANNVIGFATGGIERARLDTNGNFGIGTTSPTSALGVTGAIDSTAGYKIGGNNVLTYNSGQQALAIGIGAAANGWTDLVVGDGAQAHGHGIAIGGNANASSDQSIVIGDGSTANASYTTVIGQSLTGFTASPNEIYLGASDNGNVNSRPYSLSLMGQAAGSYSEVPLFRVGTSWLDSAYATRRSQASLYVYDATSAREFLRANTDGSVPTLSLNPTGGNVGIGTTSPSQALSVAGNALISGTATIGTLNGLITGTNGLLNAISTSSLGIALSDTTGTLPIARGGTNATSQTTNGVAYFDGTKITTGTNLTFDGSTLSVNGGNITDTIGQFIGAGGTGNSGTPPYSFAGDLTTGIFHPANNVIGFSTGGIERARLDANGNFGIGTTSPTESLQTTGNIRLSGVNASGKGIYADNGNNAGFFSLIRQNTDLSITAYGGVGITGGNHTYPNNSVSSGYSLYVSSNGNVGIGTTNPGYPLQVSSASGGTTAVRLTTNDYVAGTTGSSLGFTWGASSGNTYAAIQAGNTGGSVSGTLALQPVGGNVGIGTTTPGSLLTLGGAQAKETLGDFVTGSALQFVGSSNTGGAYIQTGNSSADTGAVLNFTRYGSANSNISQFNVHADTAYFSNLLTVGTTTPGAALTVYGQSGGTSLLIDGLSSSNPIIRIARAGTEYGGIYNLNTTSDLYIRATAAAGNLHLGAGGNSNQVILTPSGNLGIGTTTPQNALTAVGVFQLDSGGTGSIPQILLTGAGAPMAQISRASVILSGGGAANLGINVNGSANNLQFGVNGNTIETITNTGVGIGTSSPTYSLAVSSANASLFQLARSSGQINTWSEGITGSAAVGISNGSLMFTSNSAADISFDGSGIAAASFPSQLIIKGATGYVGIGTTTPAGVLSVVAKSGSGGPAAIFYGAPTATNRLVRFATSDYIYGGTTGSYLGVLSGTATGNTYMSLDALTAGGTSSGNLVLNPSGGSVGIGATTSPSAQLAIQKSTGIGLIVKGAGGDTNDHFQWQDSTGNIQGVITSLGNVGIGKTTPKAALDVNGKGYFGADDLSAIPGNVVIEDSVATASTSALTLTTGGNRPGILSINFNDRINATSQGPEGQTGAFIQSIRPNTNAEFDLAFGTSDGVNLAADATEKMRILGNGNVGIGTPNPQYDLEVTGGTGGAETDLLELRSNSTAANTASTIRLVNSTAATAVTGAAEISAIRTDTAGHSDLSFRTYGTGATMTENLRITSAGNVGIGTSAPKSRLFVAGTSEASIPSLGNPGGTLSVTAGGGTYGLIGGGLNSSGAFYLQSQRVDGTATAYNLLLQPNGGNIGIGTTSPATKLDVYSTSSSVAAAFGTINGYAVGIGSVSGAGIIQAYTNDSITSLANLSIQPNAGNVGIGTTSPSQKLSVAGNMLVSGTTTASCFSTDGVTCLGGGGTNYFTNSSATTTLSTGKILSVPTNGGFGIGNDMFAYASSTNHSTVMGIGAGGDLLTNSIGSFNSVAIGYHAGMNIHDIDSNTAVGAFSLGGDSSSQLTGEYNAAFGSDALGDLTSGIANVGIGDEALQGLTSGTLNVAIGQQSLGLSGSGMNYNVAVGGQIGGIGSVGNANTLLGYHSAYSGAGNYNIIIGQSVDAPSASGNQQLNIGNLLYGTGVYGGTSDSATPVTGGRIGIGTSTPTGTLAIADAGTSGINSLVINNHYIFRGDGQFTWGTTANAGILSWNTGLAVVGAQAGNSLSLWAGGAEKARLTTAGNFGIGTSSPFANLSLSAAAPVVAIANTNTGGSTFELRNGAINNLSFDIYDAVNNVSMLTVVRNDSNSGEVIVGSSTNSVISNNSRLFIYGGSEGANIDAMGDHTLSGGIGDQSQFEAEGADYGAGGGNTNSIAIRFYGNSFPSGLLNVLGNTTVANTGVLDFGTASRAVIRTNNATPIAVGINNAEVARFTSTGLGIGTSTPTSALSVVTSLADTEIGNGAQGGGFNGIKYGANAPNYSVTFSKAAGTAAAPTAVGASSFLGSLRFSGYDGSGFDIGAEIAALSESAFTTSSNNTKLQFYTSSGGTLAANAILTSGGDFGIGSTTPSSRLSVADNTSGYAADFFNDGNAATHAGIRIQAGLDNDTGGTLSTLIQLNDGDGTSVGQIGTSRGDLHINAGSGKNLELNSDNGSAIDFYGSDANFNVPIAVYSGLIDYTGSTFESTITDGTGSVGTNGQVLSSTGTGVKWITASGGSSQWTTSGSNISYTTGSVGIGTTSPDQLLSISETASNSDNSQLHITNTSFGGAGVTLASHSYESYSLMSVSNTYGARNAGSFVITDNTTGNDRFVIDPTGYLTLPYYGAGTLMTDSAGHVTVSSDERLKNISGDFSAGLDALEKITPIVFHWNDISGLDENDVNIGFSAQNVKAAIPDAVGVDGRGYLTLEDRPIIAASVNAIKELASTTNQLSFATTSLQVQFNALSTSFASSTLPHALTATSVTANSMTIAQGVSAGTMTTQTLSASGTVSAPRYVVPQQASVFTFGSTTVAMQVPPEALASGGNVDLYQLAGYATAGVEMLASRTDLLSVKIDDLESRVAALESLHAATSTASTTDSGSAASVAVSAITDALKSIGILIHQGYLALDSLVTHQLFLVKGDDGTSSTGSEVIPAGSTNLTVTNPLVHTSSKIFLTFTSSVDGSWFISKKQEGSFTITLEKGQAADTEFDYFLIQTDPNAQVAAAGAADTGADSGSVPAGATEGSSTPPSTSVDGGPTVSLNGDAAVQIAQGASWTDPGATAADADGTDLTSQITESGSVDADTAGLYTLTYSVTDAAGKSGSASRVVTVLAPTSAPSGGSGSTGGSGDSTGSGSTGSGAGTSGGTTGGTVTDASGTDSGSTGTGGTDTAQTDTTTTTADAGTGTTGSADSTGGSGAVSTTDSGSSSTGA